MLCIGASISFTVMQFKYLHVITGVSHLVYICFFVLCEWWINAGELAEADWLAAHVDRHWQHCSGWSGLCMLEVFRTLLLLLFYFHGFCGTWVNFAQWLDLLRCHFLIIFSV